MKLQLLFIVVFMFVFTTMSFSNENNIKSGSISVGVDDGLTARIYVLDNVTAYLGFGYKVVGPDTVGYQPLQNVSYKLGGEFLLKKTDKFRLLAFGEWNLDHTQKETAALVKIDNENLISLRYNQVSNTYKFGLRPELFITDYLSVDYKIGVQIISHGSNSKLDSTFTVLEDALDGYSEVSIFNGRGSFLSSPQIILNLGLNLYLGKFPYWPL